MKSFKDLKSSREHIIGKYKAPTTCTLQPPSDMYIRKVNNEEEKYNNIDRF